MRSKGNSTGYHFLLSLQNVVSMDLYIVPLILGAMVGLSQSDTTQLMQMTFLGAGIATLIQVRYGLKHPIMQGPSYIPLGIMAGILSTYNANVLFTSLIIGSLIVMVLGAPLKVIAPFIRRFINPLVSGTVIIVIGISLLPIAIGNVYSGEGEILEANIMIGIVSVATLLFLLFCSPFFKGIGHYLRHFSIIIALMVGTLTAIFFFPDAVHMDSVQSADLFALPSHVFGFGIEFNLSAISLILLMYAIVFVETTGTWFAIQSVTGEKLSDENLNKGAMGEGLGCLITSLLGTIPVTGYSSNVGVMSVTGASHKRIFILGGGILVLFGFMPKVSSLITAIPEAAINGVFGIICIIILMNGIRIISSEPMDDMNMLVVGVPIFLTLAVYFLPSDVLYGLPQWAQLFLSSGASVGAISAFILYMILPKNKEGVLHQ
ncbi:MAG: uracil-xanthine permease family protein [Bacilli bacterium]